MSNNVTNFVFEDVEENSTKINFDGKPLYAVDKKNKSKLLVRIHGSVLKERGLDACKQKALEKISNEEFTIFIQTTDF